MIAARERQGRGDTQTTARATRRRLQLAKVAEGTSRRGPHGSGRKQHTGDRRRGAPRCLSDTTCTGADRRGPYRRKERATADAGGGHPLAGRRPPPARRPALAREEPRPVRPGKVATPRRPPLPGSVPDARPGKGSPPVVRRERGGGDRACGGDGATALGDVMTSLLGAEGAPPPPRPMTGGRILARGSARPSAPALPGEGGGAGAGRGAGGGRA